MVVRLQVFCIRDASSPPSAYFRFSHAPEALPIGKIDLTMEPLSGIRCGRSSPGKFTLVSGA